MFQSPGLAGFSIGFTHVDQYSPCIGEPNTYTAFHKWFNKCQKMGDNQFCRSTSYSSGDITQDIVSLQHCQVTQMGSCLAYCQLTLRSINFKWNHRNCTVIFITIIITIYIYADFLSHTIASLSYCVNFLMKNISCTKEKAWKTMVTFKYCNKKKKKTQQISLKRVIWIQKKVMVKHMNQKIYIYQQALQHWFFHFYRTRNCWASELTTGEMKSSHCIIAAITLSDCSTFQFQSEAKLYSCRMILKIFNLNDHPQVSLMFFLPNVW